MSPNSATTFAAAAFSSLALAVFFSSFSGVDVAQTILACGCFSRISRNAVLSAFAQAAVSVSRE